MAVTIESRGKRDIETHAQESVAPGAGIWAPRMLSVLRVGAALAFMLHGTTKLLGYPVTGQPRPPVMSLLGFAGVLETVGGLLLIVGLLTRPVALILAIEMVIAYWMVHLPTGPFPTLNQGEPAYLFGLVFFYLAAAGGGAWSIDRALRTVDEPATVPG